MKGEADCLSMWGRDTGREDVQRVGAGLGMTVFVSGVVFGVDHRLTGGGGLRGRGDGAGGAPSRRGSRGAFQVLIGGESRSGEKVSRSAFSLSGGADCSLGSAERSSGEEGGGRGW
jgi:hypothetical protein